MSAPLLPPQQEEELEEGAQEETEAPFSRRSIFQSKRSSLLSPSYSGPTERPVEPEIDGPPSDPTTGLIGQAQRVSEARERVLENQADRSVFAGHLRGRPAIRLHAQTHTMSETNDDLTVPNVDPETGEPIDDGIDVRDVTNFLLGDELGILGIKWDERGVSLALDNAKEQWVEHPIMSTIAAAGLIFPIAAVARRSLMVGKLGTAAGKSGVLQATEQLAKAGGKVQAPGLFAAPRLVPDLATHGDDLKFLVNSDYYKMTDPETGATIGHRLFNETTLNKIVNGTADEAASAVSKKDLKKILLSDYHMMKNAAVKENVLSAARAGEDIPRTLKMRYGFQKAWGNDYFRAISSPKKDAVSRMDSMFSSLNAGGVLTAIPNVKYGDDIYRYLIGSQDETALRGVEGITDEAVSWATSVKRMMQDTLEKQHTEGFIDDDTYTLFKSEFDGVHIPAIKAHTQGAFDIKADFTRTSTKEALGPEGTKVLQAESIKTSDQLSALRSPTLKQRQKYTTRDEVEKAVRGGEILTDPEALTVAGVAKDHYLFEAHRFLRDFFIKAQDGTLPTARASMAVSRSDMSLMARSNPKIAKDYMHIDDLPDSGAANRLKRMITAAGGDSNDLPYVHKDVMDEFFGEFGLIGQADYSAGLMEVLTAVHKTSKTALNIPTHFQNLAGNLFGFLPMAGFNPFKASALRDARVMSTAFKNIAQKHRDSGIDLKQLFTKPELEKIFKKDDRYIKGVNGEKIDLAEFFSNPEMQDILETSSFEAVEGYAHLRKLFQRLEGQEANGFLKGKGGGPSRAAKAVSRAIGSLGSVKMGPIDTEKFLGTMSSWYLAEDMIPKMMYSLDLARRGWSSAAVVREVGRRMPMYATVGSTIQSGRKLWFPWITFSAETTRIMKNNLSDYPLRSMAFFNMPAITQATASWAGIAPSLDEVERNVYGLAPWAARNTSVQLSNEGVAGVGAGSAAFAGGVLGAVKGGPAGAAVGATLGGAAGAGLAKLANVEEEGNTWRAWAMDFLPHSALMPTSNSPYMIDNLIEQGDLQKVKDLSPQEPMAVLMPLMEVWQGRGSFGQEIRSEDGYGKLAKMGMGVLGFLAPPLVQKYGLKLEGPDGLYYPLDEVYGANGESLTTDKANRNVAATLTGLAVGTAAFAGSKRFAGGAPAATRLLTGAATGALTGGSLTQVNNRRLMTDLGFMKDPRTESPGHPLYDLAFNSFLGLPKSWKVSPLNELTNESFKMRTMSEKRTYLNRLLQDAVKHNQEDQARLLVGKIWRTYQAQYDGDIRMQTEGFASWQNQQMRNLKKLPALRQLSEKELKRRLLMVNEESSKFRYAHLESLRDTMNAELITRKVGSLQSASVFGSDTFDKGVF